MHHTGNIIRQARTAKGLSGTKLGKIAGVSKGAISQWENSDKPLMSGESLLLISDALGLSPEYIIFGRATKERLDAIPSHVISLAERIANVPAADQLLITSMLDHMGKPNERESAGFYEKQTTYKAPPTKEQAIKDGYNPAEWNIENNKKG